MSWLDDIGDAFTGAFSGVTNALSSDSVTNFANGVNDAVGTVAPYAVNALVGNGIGAGLGSMFGPAGGPGTSGWGMDLGTDTSNGVGASAPGPGDTGWGKDIGQGTVAAQGAGFTSPIQSAFQGGNVIGPQGFTSGGLSNLLGNSGGGLSGLQLAGGLYDMYAKNQMANKQQNYINGVQNQINGSYAPGSPEYEMMKKEMNARDAMAGRNSQWGARATELAGKVNATRMNTLAQTLGPLANVQAQQAQNQYGGLNSLFGFAQQNARMKQLQDMVGKSSGNTFNIGGQ